MAAEASATGQLRMAAEAFGMGQPWRLMEPSATGQPWRLTEVMLEPEQQPYQESGSGCRGQPSGHTVALPARVRRRV